ncbi:MULTISPECIES: histidine phosphatase family protein [unclassified Prochlorococcus]|uniref:histidine phosphatase family protein n=1 Tax=unclassified Prochlorococcus TaxID=2627481 RepID=UPI000533BB15|nr:MULTISPECIES: histidine phosphatase family protein [unclassified Prochlorococcus]KGG16443.1 Phosphoglycerate mutase [Prochlorococcus sp. MIT 0602]KGG17083.1 Phosphoglycerate mutase [Prochlorococcus sp. MIT 0603]
MSLRLLLIRHGLSSYNREKRIQGRSDLSSLTAEGKSQASKTGAALQSIPIHTVYSSPLQRAQDTAKELLMKQGGTTELILEDDLLEVDLTQWSGLTIDEVKSKFPDSYLIWKNSPSELTLNRKDGTKYKPIHELTCQAERFINKILSTYKPEEDKNIVVVGHNAILRCLILKILGNPNFGFRRIKLDNASVSIFNINITEDKQLSIQIECLNNTSHLAPKFPPKGEKPRIFLVRHGETDWNKEGRFQGQIDIPLNNNGKQQAIAAREFLKEVKFDKVFSSSMSRPIETAKIILQNLSSLEIDQKDELREIGHGLWEGKLESEIAANWGELLRKWQQSPETVQMPEGENIDEVSTRAIRCWKSICKSLTDKETALVVAHDAVNKTILCNLLGLTNADIWKVKQGNAGITIIDLSKETCQPDVVTCLNITSGSQDIFDRTAQGAL